MMDKVDLWYSRVIVLLHKGYNEPRNISLGGVSPGSWYGNGSLWESLPTYSVETQTKRKRYVRSLVRSPISLHVGCLSVPVDLWGIGIQICMKSPAEETHNLVTGAICTDWLLPIVPGYIDTLAGYVLNYSV